MDASEDDISQQEYEEPTYKLDHDEKQNPLPTIEVAHTKFEELIKAEVLRQVDEIIYEHLAVMMTTTIFEEFSESVQDQSETGSIMGNIVYKVLARLVEKENFSDITNDHLTEILVVEDTISLMTNKMLGSGAHIAEGAPFVKRHRQKVLGELRASTTMI